MRVVYSSLTLIDKCSDHIEPIATRHDVQQRQCVPVYGNKIRETIIAMQIRHLVSRASVPSGNLFGINEHTHTHTHTPRTHTLTRACMHTIKIKYMTI